MAELKTTRLHAAACCPKCGATLDAATQADGKGRGPSPDDFSVCGYCAQLLRFNKDLSHRTATLDEVPDNLRPMLANYVAFVLSRKKNDPAG